MYKDIMNYFKKHPSYNSVVHILAGIGIGILVARPFAGTHPVKWGVAFLTLSILGHLKPLFLKNR